METSIAVDLRFNHPYTMVVSGPTQSGKTFFVRRMIENIREMMVPAPDEIVWCYGVYQNAYNSMPGVRFIEGIPDIENWDTGVRRLLVLDDLMAETDHRITKLFTRGSHHCNISICQIVQNLFTKNKEQRTINLNSHYLIVFKNPRDAGQIMHLGQQMYPGQNKFVREAFKDATSEPHGYLLFDFTQGTPDNLRIRTKIFPGEQTTVYIPAKH